MVVKELKEEQYLEAIKLSEYAFQYRVPKENVPARMEMLKRHQILGVYEEEQLAAKLHLIPLGIMMNDVEWKMGGVAGVATYPEYRRTGYVKTLITEALKLMRDQNQIVSLLHPFDIAFYRKYGWEILTDQKKITIEKINLKPLAAQDGSIKRYTKETHAQHMEEMYRQYSVQYTGMLNRDSYWWKQHVYSEDTQVAVYFDTEQTEQGYLLYEIKERKMVIEEFVALNHEARVGLWNFICQHDSMVETVTMTLPSHDAFPYFLAQPNVKTELKPYFMARIVDAETCLRKFAFHTSDDRLFLHLEDSYAPWNNGSYLLHMEEVQVFKEKVGSTCVHPPKRGLHLNINSLSAILFGYKRPMELYELGYLKGDVGEVEILEKVVPTMKSAFIDFF